MLRVRVPSAFLDATPPPPKALITRNAYQVITAVTHAFAKLLVLRACMATNQKVGSSTLSGRTIVFSATYDIHLVSARLQTRGSAPPYTTRHNDRPTSGHQSKLKRCASR